MADVDRNRKATDQRGRDRLAASQLSRAKIIKNYILGYLSEYNVFQDLHQLSVPIFRSIEAAHSDGGIILSTTPPGFSTWEPTTRLQWITEQKDLDIISFDCKWIGSILHALKMPSEQGDMNVTYFIRRHLKLESIVSQVLFLSILGCQDYVAIMPHKASSALSAPSMHQNWSALSALTGMIDPFMVHKSQLDEAIRNIIKVAKKEEEFYVNPTTLVKFRWLLNPTKNWKAIHIAHNAYTLMHRSSNAITNLWKKIPWEAEDATPTFNSLQPLIADFHIKFPGFAELIRVEHKLCTRRNLSNAIVYNETLTHVIPCFSRRRAWHVCILQIDEDGRQGVYIVARQDMRESWESQTTILFDMRDPNFVQLDQVLPRIKLVAEAAIQSVKNDIQGVLASGGHGLQDMAQTFNSGYHNEETDDDENGRPDDEDYGIDDEMVTNANRNDSRKKKANNKKTQSTPGNWERTWEKHEGSYRLRACFKFGLPNLIEDLNHWAWLNRRHLFYSLDWGHPLGTHFVIEYDWKDEDVKNWTDMGTLPKPFSPDFIHRRCIVLRIFDAGSTQTPYPLVIRSPSWPHPFIEQHILFIGSTDALYEEEWPEYDGSYLCLPSEFTTYFDENHIRERKNKGDINEYIRRENIVSSKSSPKDPIYNREGEEVQSKFPANCGGSGKQMRVFGQRSFIRSGVWPLRFIIDAANGTLYQCIVDMFAEKEMSIPNVAGCTPTPSFSTAKYHTTPSQLYQAAVDYGLRRKKLRPTDKAKKITLDEDATHYQRPNTRQTRREKRAERGNTSQYADQIHSHEIDTIQKNYQHVNTNITNMEAIRQRQPELHVNAQETTTARLVNPRSTSDQNIIASTPWHLNYHETASWRQRLIDRPEHADGQTGEHATSALDLSLVETSNDTLIVNEEGEEYLESVLDSTCQGIRTRHPLSRLNLFDDLLSCLSSDLLPSSSPAPDVLTPQDQEMDHE